VVSSIPV
jgi:hypothetical protein